MVRGTKQVIAPISGITAPVKETDIDYLLNLGKKIYETTKNPADVTINNLENLLDKRLNHAPLYAEYSKKKEELDLEYNLNIPLMALFRADVIGQPIEEHPLIKARAIYKKFQPSRHDWQRFTTLPIQLGIKECELLGIILADQSETEKPWVILYGKGKNATYDEFYEEIVSPRIKETFNLPAPVIYPKHTGKLPNSKGELKTYEYTEPKILLCSSALRTWLNYDLGFPYASKVAKNLSEKYQKLAFAEGYVAAKGLVYPNYNDRILMWDSKEKLQTIANILKSFAIRPAGPHNKTITSALCKHEACCMNIFGPNLIGLKLIHPMHKEVLLHNADDIVITPYRAA